MCAGLPCEQPSESLHGLRFLMSVMHTQILCGGSSDLKERQTARHTGARVSREVIGKDSDPLLDLFIVSNLCCGVPGKEQDEPKTRSHDRE